MRDSFGRLWKPVEDSAIRSAIGGSQTAGIRPANPVSSMSMSRCESTTDCRAGKARRRAHSGAIRPRSNAERCFRIPESEVDMTRCKVLLTFRTREHRGPARMHRRPNAAGTHSTACQTTRRVHDHASSSGRISPAAPRSATSAARVRSVACGLTSMMRPPPCSVASGIPAAG